MRTGHLFSGAGGGIYADLILGHTPVFAVEWDPYACGALRSRVEDEWFPGLRVHEGDVRLFDPSEYKGQVDCLHAGFPCQDISTAGRGTGIHGERSGLYREVLRCADVIRPRYIFLENSAAILSRGLGTVLGDLAQLGYNAKWTVLAAAEVGANHERNRWWCLAEREAMANPQGVGYWQGGEIGNLCKADGGPDGGLLPVLAGPGQEIPDAHGQRLEVGKSREPRKQPAPFGSGWWELEPDVGRLAPRVALRSHQIKCLGNGQVPLCAAAAWKILMNQIPLTGEK